MISVIASIRRARAEDGPVVAANNVAMARETEAVDLDADRVAAGVRAVLADPGKGFYLIAEAPDPVSGRARVVGQLMVTFEWSDWRDGQFWWIQSVYVPRAFRRTGVYRALHEAVAARAREAGACGLRLYVEQENANAQEVYRRMGMDRTNYQLFEIEF